jgi:hypothetical protein
MDIQTDKLMAAKAAEMKDAEIVFLTKQYELKLMQLQEEKAQFTARSSA